MPVVNRIADYAADMDGRAITEAAGLEYACRNAGRIHVCGHTTMLLGARAL